MARGRSCLLRVTPQVLRSMGDGRGPAGVRAGMWLMGLSLVMDESAGPRLI
jgi:hypothetical protein